MDDTIDAWEKQLDTSQRLLPAWLTARMMGDEWSFALLLTDGSALLIEHIDAIHQAADGTIWIDVRMMQHENAGSYFCKEVERRFGVDVIRYAPCSRGTCSVNAQHVMAAIEIADT